MKKIRVLSGLLVVVLVLSILTTSVFAADSSSKVVLSDVPYDYGVVSFSEEWDELTTTERKAVFTIPESTAKNLTTKALLKTILSNPYITEIFLYDTVEKGIEMKDFRFNFTELFNRSDVNLVLGSYIDELIVKLDLGGKINQNTKLEDVSESELSLISDYIICSSLYEYLNNNNVLSDNLRATTINVQTLGNLWVTGIKDRSWSNVLGGEWAITITEQKLESNYPNAIKLQDKSPVYNCHCYAWHTNYVSSDLYIWIESDEAATYLTDPYCSLINRVTTGCQVVYFDPDGVEMLHSGFVTSLSGNNIYVVSKMGNCGVYRHLLQDCSYYEDSEGYINYYMYAKDE